MAESCVDVLVVGAGQAGLALARSLQTSNLTFRVVERQKRIGDSWRHRYDSLTLFTPREFSALPGMQLGGDPAGFPSKDEIADYLESYSQKHAFPVSTDTSIEKLWISHEGSFGGLTNSGETIYSKAVVVATGAFQVPMVPGFAGKFSREVVQLTTESYRSVEQLDGKSVLVVGDGATGRQIAREIALKKSVVLATGHSRKLLPDRILGKSIFWWLNVTGFIRASSDSFIGSRIKKADAFPGRDLSLPLLEKSGVKVLGKLTDARADQALFINGHVEHVDTVIWAIGYRDSTEWIAIPNAKDAEGRFLEEAGVSPIAGLFYIGRHWQRSRGSSLLLGVAADAMKIVDEITQFLHASRSHKALSSRGNSQ